MVGIGLKQVGCGVAEFHTLLEIGAERLLKVHIEERCYHLSIGEGGIVVVCCLDIQRHNTSHPTLTLDDIRCPTELFDCLQYTTGEEYRTFTIIGKLFTALILGHGATTLEIVFIVDEVNLQT